MGYGANAPEARLILKENARPQVARGACDQAPQKRGEVLLEGLLGYRVGLHVARTWLHLPPTMSMQKSIQIVVRNRMTNASFHLGLQFGSGQE
jgi:hypothetical protein